MPDPPEILVNTILPSLLFDGEAGTIISSKSIIAGSNKVTNEESLLLNSSSMTILNNPV